MRSSKLRRLLAVSGPALLWVLPLGTQAAEPFDNDELVAGAEFQGLPDRDSHSGVFHDLIAGGSSSLSQPARFSITCALDSDRLRLAIFDGNAAGLWDQNLLLNGPDGTPLPDGSVVRYAVTTISPDAAPELVAVGESEALDAQSADVTKVFSNGIDGRWEFLVDAPHHPAARVAATETYVYQLLVGYRLPIPTGGGRAPINGYKIAANGVLALDPGTNQTQLAGFIGGVVDARNLIFRRADGSEFSSSVSRDHYPDVLEPPPSWNDALALEGDVAPAVRFPAGDPFVNRFDGSFSVRLRMVPQRGESWAQFLTRMVLEEGDADDVDDVGGVASDGSASPSAPGVPPDDGRPYTLNGVARDNSGYRLPTSTEPGLDGSPWLELFDPNGVLRVVQFDLSGNVSQETGTESGFEAIPVPLDGVPGDWVVVMHNLDARNSWFLRTNLAVRSVDGQSLTGRVFEDLDCDGTDDVRVDPPLAGIRVQAIPTDVPGAAPRFAVTDALGEWRFDPLPVGTWSVTVVPGQPALAGRTTSTTLPIVRTLGSRQNLFGLDLGFCPVGTIGDRVWFDRDGDGQQTVDEPGLPNVTVELLDASGASLRTTTTDADGAYRFDNLPAGGFTVRTDPTTVPAGYGPTTPASIDLTLPEGGSIGTADFGDRPVGSVGDRVWRDDDGDDVQDEGEPGLPGVTVELRSEADALLASQATGPDGRYLLPGLDAGTYFVRVLDATAPAGSQRTTPTDTRAATIPAGGSDVTLDFGYRPTGTVTGTVFRDGDGDGVRDAGEPPIGGIEIRLLTPAGVVVATTTTSPDGTYTFASVPVGDYLVNVVEGNPRLDGLTRTTPGQPVAVTVAADTPTPPVDFGYRPSQDVSGRVWLDRDGDGVQDADELGLRNVSVELMDPNGVVRAFRTTSATGAYLFEDVLVGPWSVRVVTESLPAGLTLTTPPAPRPITVIEAVATTDVDFGYRGTAAVGDRIWLDLDGDTQQDAGEPGIDGVVVEVVDDLTSAPFGRRTTGPDGLYLVDGLPAGTYRLVVDATTLPKTLTRTSATASPVGAVAAGGQDLTLDVGYRFVGAIGDRVWFDTDGDGLQDVGEPGVGGVTLELLDANGAVVRATATARDGGYLFDGLADGTYTVRVVPASLPTGLTNTFGGTQQSATITSASTDLSKDFGYGTPRGVLGGRVWIDADGDGLQDPTGEPGLPGVTVELLDTGGRVLASVLTGPTGSYTFPGLADGNYAVRILERTLPSGLERTFPATPVVPATVGNASTDLTKDFGYRAAPPTCDAGADPRVHEVCFEASVWLADPSTRAFDVYARIDRGARAGDLLDLVCFDYAGAFPGTQVGANRVLRVEGLTVVDGYAKVRVCVVADPRLVGDGWFDGTFRLEVVVNGVGEAASDAFTRATLVPGATFPHDGTPLWCDDVPDFAIRSVLSYACWETPPPPTTCVHDVGWWRTVNAKGACDATRVPWPVVGGENRRRCGKTWLAILKASAKDDPWVALAQSWIVAQLNVAAGAAAPPRVACALDEAASLLAQGCAGFCGLAEERAVLLHRTLKDFNRGTRGPVACASPVPTCPAPPKTGDTRPDPKPAGNAPSAKKK